MFDKIKADWLRIDPIQLIYSHEKPVLFHFIYGPSLKEFNLLANGPMLIQPIINPYYNRALNNKCLQASRQGAEQNIHSASTVIPLALRTSTVASTFIFAANYKMNLVLSHTQLVQTVLL